MGGYHEALMDRVAHGRCNLRTFRGALGVYIKVGFSYCKKSLVSFVYSLLPLIGRRLKINIVH
jgi:hypothetical protein